MNEALLIDMFYAAPELWYTLGLGLAVLLFLMGAQGINILKLRQKLFSEPGSRTLCRNTLCVQRRLFCFYLSRRESQ